MRVMPRRRAALYAPVSTVPQEQSTGGAARALGGIAATALRPATGVLAFAWRTTEDAAVWTVDRLLASRIAEEVVDAILTSGLVERAVDQAFADGIAEAVADRLLEGPELERIADRVVDSPATERVVGRVMESQLVDDAVARLLDSDELWVMVDEIAKSEAVTEAIGRQSIGFADQVAGVVRDRSARADERLERIARRLLRRRQRDGEATP
jgi:hypothetical protein